MNRNELLSLLTERGLSSIRSNWFLGGAASWDNSRSGNAAWERKRTMAR